MELTENESSLSLRREQPEDERFRFALYASTRQEELDALGWPPEARTAFLEMQFKAQDGYRTRFPQADFQIILLGGQPVGRLIVNRAESEFRLVDIALLPDARNSGVGTRLIQGLMAEAARAGKPLRLTVRKGGRAAGLYHRLGFVKCGESELDDEMEWHMIDDR